MCQMISLSHSKMFCGMSLFFQETTAYNVCTLAGKEYPKKMFKVRYREGGNAYSTEAATGGVL